MAKPRGRYKDSTPVRLTYESEVQVPRRKLKQMFDTRKANVLSELTTKKDVAFARNYTFQQFLDELQDSFQCAVDMGEVALQDGDDRILEWAEEIFEGQVVP